MTHAGSGEVEPFRVSVDADQLRDLQNRLSRTRWPDELSNDEWEYGTNRAYLKELTDYWETDYDWQAFVDRVNAFDQFKTRIDGQPIHFYHVKSDASDAAPLLMLHGWPSTAIEFLEVIDRLAEPDSHSSRAFDVVVPSLPGYGFSGPTREPGYGVERMAQAFLTLMRRLGYDQFLAQGEDWGAWILTYMAANWPERLDGIYPHTLFVNQEDLDDPMEMLNDADMAVYRETQAFRRHETGYHRIQGTKPQTVAYGLNDSPVGLAAWIVEKWRTWTDCTETPESIVDRDRLLDTVSVYWLTETINSSMRLYYEMYQTGREVLTPDRVDVPTGHARHPAAVAKVPRPWAEAVYDIQYWSEPVRGGHFPALEVPDLFVSDLRRCFDTLLSDSS